MLLTKSSFAALVDHTILKPDATRQQIITICDEAQENKMASVCVNGRWTSLVADQLKGSSPRTCCVVGFPLGAVTEATIAFEISDAIANGAEELDMVLPIGLLLEKEYPTVLKYLKVARAAAEGIPLKGILESALLSDEQLVQACQLATEAELDFVKTSTGFNPAGGASGHAVKLMRKIVGSQMGVKASGGIRTIEDVQTMLAAGANRLGLSKTMQILAKLPES